MGAIIQGELRVTAAISMENIQEFSMKVRKDRHAECYLKGTVSEDIGESILFQPIEQTEVIVHAGEEVLFVGIIKEMQIIHEGNGYQGLLYGISATERLDHEKKNRSFQDVNRTYTEIMQEVLADIVGAWAILHVDNLKIGTPIYQIEETDWEFIKRISSNLLTSIIPFELSPKPKIHIGLPKGRLYEDEVVRGICVKTWRDSKNKCIYRNIKSHKNLKIGDLLRWEGIEYLIAAKTCRMIKGLIYFQYTVARKGAYASEQYDNPHSTGILLPATVLKTKEEQVKVKFDMDKVQLDEGAYWYPWRPDVGNLMYCMPEKGELVYIQMGDSYGMHTKAICSKHKNGLENFEMKNNNIFFTTADNKRIYLTKDKIGFRDLNQTSHLQVEVNDVMGTTIKSNRKVVVSAKDTIEIKANTIFFRAPKEVSIVRRDVLAPTVINMCNGFDSIGATNGVTMSGSSDNDFPIFHDIAQEEGEEYSLDGVEKDIIASNPTIRLKSGIEKQIEGAKVDKVILKEDKSG